MIIGGAIIVIFFVIFLGWAALAPLDAGAYAQGQIAVSGNRQAVQHREGGVVSALRWPRATPSPAARSCCSCAPAS